METRDEITLCSRSSQTTERNLFFHKGFYENILPAYKIDEFKSHFRMTQGTFEPLCQEVQATETVPQQQAFGRPPIPFDKQALAFV